MMGDEPENRDQIVGLRRAVVEYHSTARMRRVEQRLNPPSIDPR